MEEIPKESEILRKPKKMIPKFSLKKSYIFDRVARTASDMWNATNDPFQVFEVEHESCLDLTIHVRRGEHITKGFYKDLIDIPDPYVILRVPGSSNSSKRTSHVDNTSTPEWNETFHFFLDPKKTHTLQVTLMDANHLKDEVLGVEELDINLIIQNVTIDYTFEFEGGSKIHTTITLEKNQNPDLRFSLSLCEEEKTFLRERRQKVLCKMQALLGDKAPQSKNEVPIIAVMGSGGGFRAMTCFSAASKALHDSGLLGFSTYISGLSGSSWLISTLYANDKFPNITFKEIYDDLNASVTTNWMWKLMHCHRYILAMLEKKRRGQPVSFTDIFGHLLGDVLLKGNKNKTLSDQRHVLKGGKVPLPLYTCLHAKASVSCKSFSEWIEFSPYEIGIAKYGTFMKTEFFGSKFLVGKMIKQYPEFPLHYLQGVWGSAFTILMKRLAFDGGSKQDIVQMMRDVNEERAINEKLEEENLDTEDLKGESDSDDEGDIEGADDKSEEEETEDSKHRTLEEEKERLRKILGTESVPEDDDSLFKRFSSKETKTDDDKKTKTIKSSSRTDSSDKLMHKGFSFDIVTKRKQETTKNLSVNSKLRAQSVPSIPDALTAKGQLARRRDCLQRKNAFKEGKADTNLNYWSNRKSKRKTQKARRSTIFQSLMKNSGVLNSRAGRAGEVLNPFRGLSLRNSFPLSPFTLDFEKDDTTDETDIGIGCRYEALDNTAKKLFIVDSGLAFNSPYPLLLRPQRAVDMYISFDFSQRPSDRHMPFKELLLAEKWANQNQVPFPPIQQLANDFANDPEVKELYIFKHPNDPFCPVILHFTIVNNKFRHYKAPGVPRTTEAERDFAHFSLFDDPSQPYASTNFVYDSLQFERLFKLVEFNTLMNIDAIKLEIEEMVQKKRKLMDRVSENMFVKISEIAKSCRRFRNMGSLSLRVNEKRTKTIILANRSMSRSSACGEEFQDACYSIDDLDTDSDSEFQDASEREDRRGTQIDVSDTPAEKGDAQIDVSDAPIEKDADTDLASALSQETLPKSTENNPDVDREPIRMIQTLTAVI